MYIDGENNYKSFRHHKRYTCMTNFKCYNSNVWMKYDIEPSTTVGFKRMQIGHGLRIALTAAKSNMFETPLFVKDNQSSNKICIIHCIKNTFLLNSITCNMIVKTNELINVDYKESARAPFRGRSRNHMPHPGFYRFAPPNGSKLDTV